MKTPKLLTALLLWLVVALPATSRTPASDITVFAAASMKESLDEVAAAWTRHSGQEVRVSYAGSSALARQIEQGAPADLFISADLEWMDHLQQRNLIDPNSRAELVGNQLVLIAPVASPLKSVNLADRAALATALGGGRLAVADTAGVPAGRYAMQSLKYLKLWDGVSTRLAQSENVRAAMAFVARGESPLGIVYSTDAQAEPKVKVVARFPNASHAPIVYPVARVSTSAAASSTGFLRFLRSREAQRIFNRYGFTPR
ncbi:MAG: molybdate ABC transporter substrate-binding protein [Lysobacteraceae bacterium]